MSMYLDDTQMVDQQSLAAPHPDGGSFRRVDLDEGDEKKTDGNGMFGHDETNENFSTARNAFAATWEIAATANPEPEVDQSGGTTETGTGGTGGGSTGGGCQLSISSISWFSFSGLSALLVSLLLRKRKK